MTDDDKALVERLRSRVSNREMLLVDPPRPAPDRDCHHAADRIEALCRDIERHEAFKQEVSDAVREVTQLRRKLHTLARFIIAKPDPLVEVLIGAFGSGYGEPEAGHLRAALAIHGLEIVEKSDD